MRMASLHQQLRVFLIINERERVVTQGPGDIRNTHGSICNHFRSINFTQAERFVYVPRENRERTLCFRSIHFYIFLPFFILKTDRNDIVLLTYEQKTAGCFSFLLQHFFLEFWWNILSQRPVLVSSFLFFFFFFPCLNWDVEHKAAAQKRDSLLRKRPILSNEAFIFYRGLRN